MTDTTKGFTLTRELLATPQQIWDAWTDPDRMADWYHPRGFSTPRETVEVDLRKGGHYTYTMVNDASGEKYPTPGIYREIFEPQRLAFTWGDPDDPFLVTLEIEPLGDLTKLIFHLDGYDGMSGDDSFYDGWEQAIDSLAGYLMGQEPIG